MVSCTMEGCAKPHKGHGYCEMHLLRWRKYGDPTVVRRRQPNPDRARAICHVDGCGRFTVGRGLCRNHYMRQYRRGGDPAENLPRGNFTTPVSARTHLFTMGMPDECWEWQGATNRNGYGVTGVWGAGGLLAHRAVYEELVRPVGNDADGNPLQLDHLCANKICVNPNHLDPCTRRENLFRGGEPHFELRGKAAHY